MYYPLEKHIMMNIKTPSSVFQYVYIYPIPRLFTEKDQKGSNKKNTLGLITSDKKEHFLNSPAYFRSWYEPTC